MSTSTALDAERRPGRQRSVAADEAIVAATLSLLGEYGFGGVTMAAVIERAGVSSATLYRRYSNKEALVEAALATLASTAPDIDTGSLHGDLKTFVGNIARAITNRREDVMDALGVESKRNEVLRQRLRDTFLEPRLQTVEAILDRAVARGELQAAPPSDVAFSLITGPVYHRGLVYADPLSPAFLRTVVAFAEQGLRAFGA
jgi:AcrR family transcriptional regulator